MLHSLFQRGGFFLRISVLVYHHFERFIKIDYFIRFLKLFRGFITIFWWCICIMVTMNITSYYYWYRSTKKSLSIYNEMICTSVVLINQRCSLWFKKYFIQYMNTLNWIKQQTKCLYMFSPERCPLSYTFYLSNNPIRSYLVKLGWGGGRFLIC